MGGGGEVVPFASECGYECIMESLEDALLLSVRGESMDLGDFASCR